MADFYITDTKPFEDKIKLCKEKNTLTVDITDIFLLGHAIRYKVEYADKSGRLKSFFPKMSIKESDGEATYLISFKIPAKSFNIIQYRIDRFGYEREIYYSFPIEILRE